MKLGWSLALLGFLLLLMFPVVALYHCYGKPYDIYLAMNIPWYGWAAYAVGLILCLLGRIRLDKC